MKIKAACDITELTFISAMEEVEIENTI